LKKRYKKGKRDSNERKKGGKWKKSQEEKKGQKKGQEKGKKERKQK